MKIKNVGKCLEDEDISLENSFQINLTTVQKLLVLSSKHHLVRNNYHNVCWLTMFQTVWDSLCSLFHPIAFGKDM